MSEATPSPEPPAGGPSDPTAPPTVPEPTPWVPPDPLGAPQPWAAPTPWSPPDATGSGTSSTPGHPATSPFAAGHPVPTSSYFPTDRPGTPPAAGPFPADRPGPLVGPRPAVPAAGAAGTSPAGAPPGGTPPPGHPWPGYGPSHWPPSGYPPPYAYPGVPPSRTGGGRVAAIVISVTTVLVLIFCGCVGLGVLGSFVDDPAGDSYDGSEGSWPTGPDEPDESGDADSGLVTAVPTRSPAVTPSGGTGRLTVVYEVTGSDLADLEYYDANGDFVQTERVQLPWRLKLTTDGTDRVMVLASHSDFADTSPLGCRILVDGKVVAQDRTEYGADCYA